MSSFLKHAFSTMGTRIVLMSLAFLQGIIIARYLLPEGRGLISVYLASVNMILPLGEVGIKQSSAYFLKKINMDLNDIINIQTITLILSSLLSIIILNIIYISQGLHNHFILTLIFLALPLRIYISFSTSIALVNRDIDTINIIQIILIGADFLMVVLFFVIFHMHVEIYFVSYFISSFFAALYTFFWLKRKYSIHFIFNISEYRKKALPVIKKGISFALPLFVIGLNYSLDIIMLNYYVDKKSIGIYSVGVSLAILLWQLPSILTLLIFSYSVSTNDENKFSLNLWDKSKIVMLVMIPVAIIIVIASKYVIPIVYGVEFTNSYEVLMWLMPGVYMMIIFKLLNGDMAARGFPMIAFYIFSFSAGLNIILNIYLIPIYSINGAAIASSISYSIASIIFTIKYKILLINSLRNIKNV